MRSAVHCTGRFSCARRIGDHDVLGIEPGLHAEAAADVADDHADLLLGNAQHLVASVSRTPEGIWLLRRSVRRSLAAS